MCNDDQDSGQNDQDFNDNFEFSENDSNQYEDFASEEDFDNNPPHEPEDSWEPSPSWERRNELGFAKAFLSTFGDVLLHPRTTFSRMSKEGDVMVAATFGMVSGTVSYWLGAVTAGLVGFLFFQTIPPMQPPPGAEPLPEFFPYLMVGGMVMFRAIFAPVSVLITIILTTSIVHIFLQILGGANRDFGATLRVVCYCFGATVVLAVIPYCGQILGFLLTLIYLLEGLSQMHETEPWRIALALPFLLVIGCFCMCLFGPIFH